METFLDILKYTIPATIVMIACVVIVRRFLMADFREKQLSLLRDNQSITVRLRLQAYERLVLFLERIHPRQLIPRIYHSDMTVAELEAAIIFNIRAEYEHNLSQQIYVTRQVWNAVRGVKEQEINMVSQIARQLSPSAPAKDLHQRMVDYLLTVEDMPIEVAMQVINEEAKTVLSFGSGA